MSRSRVSAASPWLLAAALAAVAFGGSGGTGLQRTSLVHALLALAAGLVLAYAVLRLRPRDRAHGAAPVLAFAALAALTALSLSWSIAPHLSLEEAGRAFAYLGVFTAAVVAAHAFTGAAGKVVGAIALAAVAVCGWALVTRVFPGSLAELEFGARLGAPYGYWNALGVTAAIGVVPLLWLAARRDGSRIGRALAWPGLGVVLLTIVLTQSRGSLLGAAVAVAIWVTAVPLRLRSLVALAAASVAVAPVAAWALSKDAFTDVNQPVSAREALAGDFGLMLMALAAVLLAAGLGAQALGARRPPSLRIRRRAGLAAASLACLVPLVALTSVALSDRGLTGTISDRVGDLTDENAAPPAGAGRLGSVSSARSQYWGEAVDVFEEKPFAGRGAGAFEIARLRYRDDRRVSTRAHGFIPQTLSDLGLAGLAVALALLAAWCASAARAVGLTRPPRGLGWPPERQALTALALAAIAFGMQTAGDWTWFIPGPAVLGLVAAGFVAGRGPLASPGTGARPQPRTEGRPSTERIVWAAAIVLAAAIFAWLAWQPARAERAVERSRDLRLAGDLGGALREADRARDINRLDFEATLGRADALRDAGRLEEALAAHRLAVREHPRNPRPLVALATFTLATLDQPEAARRIADVIRERIDPLSREAEFIQTVTKQEPARR